MSPFVAHPLFALLALAIILAAAGGQGIALPFAVAVMWLGVLRLHLRGSHWQGAAMLVLVWLVFPLLKTVNASWITWHADGLLTWADSALWGGRILPAYLRYEDYPVAADVFAACYFVFFFIVLGAVGYYACAARRRPASAAAFFSGLHGIYLWGFAGYFLLPAAGPAFTVLPDAGAQGFIAPHVIAIVKDGVTGMDVFPSLHTALPLFITAFLWRDGRRLAALLLAPVSLGIVVSTVFLRYHYGVDVLAGMLLAAAMAWRYTQKIL